MTRRVATWWVGAFLALALIYASGVLRSNALPRVMGDYPTGMVNSAPHFDRVSEVLVENYIDRRFAGLPESPKGFMFHVPYGDELDPRIFALERPADYLPDWRPSPSELRRPGYYRSQIGLQARAYSAVSDALGLSRSATYAVLRGLSAVALAGMLATLVTLIAGAWGGGPALAALAFCALATGFNLFAPRLYWVTFLHVAPTVILALYAAGLPGRGNTARAIAFGLAGAVFVAKFASGYEFLTVTIAAATVPFFISFAAGRIPMKSLILHASAVLALGVIAFAATLGAYEALYLRAFGESGLAFLRTRSGEWSGLPFMGPLGSPLQIAKVAMINTVDVGGWGLPNLLFLAAGAPFVWVAARALATRRFDDERSRIAIAVSAALLASASWPLFQFPHVSFHPRYSTILTAFPYGLVLIAALARMWRLRRAGSAR